MKELIIYPFGTSDLYVDGICFTKDKDGNFKKNFDFVGETEKLKDDFGNKKITFPIFENLIKKLDKNSEYKILGIFTKQNSGNGLDTYNLEKIFDKYLKKNFNNIKLLSNNIFLKEAQKTNVIFSEIKKFFENKKDFFSKNNFDDFIINLTGGTKGIVLGTFQACIDTFEIDKLRFFVVNENDNRAIEFINIKNFIIKSNNLKNLKLLINNFDFKGIFNFTLDKKIFSEINKISQYAFKMLDFEVDEANKIFEKFENNGIELPFYFKENQKDIVKLALNGIYFTWITKNLVEFLGRIYSFSDILLNLIFKENLNLNLEKYEDLKNLNNNDLEEFLNKYKIENQKLDWDINVNETLKGRFLNLPVKKAILEYFIYEESYIDLEIYLNFIKKLEKLNKFRNKTIIAHGTNGVSLEKTKQNFEGNLEENLKNIYKELGFGEKFFVEEIKLILESNLEN